jgi:hypothetical protein
VDYENNAKMWKICVRRINVMDGWMVGVNRRNRHRTKMMIRIKKE